MGFGGLSCDRLGPRTDDYHSSSDSPLARGEDRWRRRCHVDCGGPLDLRNDYELYPVLSGGARVLTSRRKRRVSVVKRETVWRQAV